MRVAYCNDCKKQFQIEPKEEKLEEEKLENDVTRFYFKCPHCDKEYTSYYSNVLIRKKQEKMNNLNKKFLSERDLQPQKALKTYKQIKKLKKEIGQDMDKLQKRIESPDK
ncbi:transglycosylase [Clostridium sp. D2Q-14]|uniref:transglycosylase n=1 Tax=Anaeromonas gelatinilytica TaxID=2683194 RepID=UPI00193B951C|nr:transglycosylase [Anaeromonas gelatinilytica]MBS4536816.1 transglycosylase [Anaeromonas gelatinilytica]